MIRRTLLVLATCAFIALSGVTLNRISTAKAEKEAALHAVSGASITTTSESTTAATDTVSSPSPLTE